MANTLNDCLAPAKLNLFLHVTGRRADGYHELQTVFQLLNHGDVLHFRTRDDGQILRCSDLVGVPPDSDLVNRAARLLRSAAPEGRASDNLGAEIVVEKRLPMGGGLGGGSSDAATTLIALNHLWQLGLDRERLMQLGLQLGADVPFFLFGQNAFAEGIGEALQPVVTAQCWYVVVEPGVAAPTAAIFSDPELTRDTKPITITDFSESPNGFEKNDLQVVATRLYPDIAQAIGWLRQFGKARMTGSGACVFCAFNREDEAEAVLQQMRSDCPASWKGWKARAMERHPLSHLLQS